MAGLRATSIEICHSRSIADGRFSFDSTLPGAEDPPMRLIPMQHREVCGRGDRGFPDTECSSSPTKSAVGRLEAIGLRIQRNPP